MWIFTRYGFYSIACASKTDGSIDSSTVMVRARRRDHLTRLQERFPEISGVQVLRLPNTDYRYRLVIQKEQWVAIVAALANEQEWSNFKKEVSRFQGLAGAEYAHSLHTVWSVTNDLQQSELQSARVQRDTAGVITNAQELTASELAHQRVLCPACGKVFEMWPEGWDGNAGWACNVEGATPEERKATFKARFRHLFR